MEGYPKSIGNEPYCAIGQEIPGDSVFSGFFETHTDPMTEGHRLDAHANAHNSLEHKQIEAQKAIESVKEGIADVTQRIANGQEGLARYEFQVVFDDLSKALKERVISQEQYDELYPELQHLFELVEGKEAA